MDFLIGIKDAIFLMGNHEYYYLQYITKGTYKDKILKYGKTAFKDFNMNLDSIYDKLYKPYKDFFDNLILYYELDNYLISHAGIDVDYLEKDLKSLEPERFCIFNRYNFISLNKKVKNKIVIFGHTGFSRPYYDGFKIGIDTAAAYREESPITAFCIEKEFFIDSNDQKYELSSLRKDVCPLIKRIEPYRVRNENF